MAFRLGERVMAATNGKLRLVLRSKKVLVRTEDYESSGVTSGSLTAWNGQLFGTRRRVMVYDYVYDERQKQALKEGARAGDEDGARPGGDRPLATKPP